MDIGKHQIGMVARNGAVRNGRGQRLEDGVDHRHGEGHPHAHGVGPLGADDGAHGHDHLQRPEAAVIDRVVGGRGQAFVGHLRAGNAGGEARVVETLDLAAHVGEVDLHLVALDGHLHADRDALAHLQAVVVHEGLGLVHTVGNRQGVLPRQDLRGVHDLADGGLHRVVAVALHQLQKAPLAGGDGGDLRAQVTQGPLGQAHVHGNDVNQVLVHHAGLLVLDDGHLDALGEDVGGDLAEAAAYVQPVRHAAGKANELALVEHRHGEGEVVQVAARGVGVVGDQDVARLDVLVAKVPDLGFHRLGHAPDEHGQAQADGDRLTFLGEQAYGEIQRLINDEVVGRAHEVGLHFLGHGKQAVADDLDDDGVDRLRLQLGGGDGVHERSLPMEICRLPKGSTWRLSPG